LYKIPFNVGDTVRIKHHTQRKKEQYPFHWTIVMDQYEGETFVIKKVLHGLKSPYSGKIETGYKLESRENIFTWHGSSLLKIENKHYHTF
jgi:hypothetical protein